MHYYNIFVRKICCSCFFFVLGSGQVRKIKGWFGILVYTCYMKHVGYCGRILPNLVQVGFLGWFPYWSHQMSSDLSVAQPPTTLHCDMVLVCSFELASPSSLDDIFVFWICLDYFTHDVIEYNIIYIYIQYIYTVYIYIYTRYLYIYIYSIYIYIYLYTVYIYTVYIYIYSIYSMYIYISYI